jgi:hypothetical protein
MLVSACSVVTSHPMRVTHLPFSRCLPGRAWCAGRTGCGTGTRTHDRIWIEDDLGTRQLLRQRVGINGRDNAIMTANGDPTRPARDLW